MLYHVRTMSKLIKLGCYGLEVEPGGPDLSQIFITDESVSAMSIGQGEGGWVSSRLALGWLLSSLR